MTDVLKIIRDLTDSLWAKYGDVLSREKSQEEVHMTYYAGELMRRRGHKWFRADGIEGACYTEKAMQDAFTAGRRIGQAEAKGIAQREIDERLESAHAALRGQF
jgi:hypothetical protein